MGMLPRMAGSWKTRLRQLVAEKGLPMKAASKAAKKNETLIRDLLERTDDPRVSTLQKVARVYGVSFAWLIEGQEAPRIPIRIIGEVSAGESWEAIDDHTPGAGEEEFLDLEGVDPIGIRVRGPSMSPIYRQGDIIIASRLHGINIQNALNQDCIVRTVKRESYVKVLRRGTMPNRYTLRSYNPKYDDVENVALEWVAPVRWVKRG